MSQTLTALITSARTLARDTTTSNFIKGETPDGAIDNSNTKFRLQNRNVVGTNTTTHSVYLTYGSNFRVQTGFTVDLTNAVVTFNSAPNNVTILADYNFNWCTDTEVTEFLNQAGRCVLIDAYDPTTVTEGLIPALLQFTLFFYFQAIASEYGRRYASSGGQAGQSVQTVTKDYLEKAKLAWETGQTMRTDYYQRKGEREAPASGTISFNMDPFTPRR